MFSLNCCSKSTPHPAEVARLEELEEQARGLMHREVPRSTGRRCNVWLCICCVISVFLALAGVYFGLVYYATNKSIGSFLTIDKEKQTSGNEFDTAELVYNSWWPGCGFVDSMADFTKECTEPCFSPELMKAMKEFNERNPSRLVAYSSRPKTTGAHRFETVHLKGWWMPAPRHERDHGPHPRIVLQHGFTQNSNMFRQQLAAYQLRLSGFDVLVNNFRDHGHSASSKSGIYQWGNAYPYDTLGAWDYARTDPDGILGGALPASKVGLMGFSKGAFVSTQSFGLEGDVPGLWVQAGPFSPREAFTAVFEKELKGMNIGFLAPLFAAPVWEGMKGYALDRGVDLEYHQTTDTLPLGPETRRKVFVVANDKDTTVPVASHKKLLALLKKLDTRYEVAGDWVVDDTCNGNVHVIVHLAKFDQYKQMLCNFWSGVFEMDAGRC